MSNTTFLGIPYLKTRISPDLYDKKEIINTIEHNYNISNYRNKFDKHEMNRSNFHHFFKDEDNKSFKIVNYDSLKDLYDKVVQDFIRKLSFKNDKYHRVKYRWDIVNYTVCNEGQYMRYHDHIVHADFFMIHYLQFDKEVHKPTLYNNTHIFSDYIRDFRTDLYNCLENNLDNAWLKREVYIDVEEDDLVLAPAAIPHMIPVNDKSNKNRITIVSNIKINNESTG